MKASLTPSLVGAALAVLAAVGFSVSLVSARVSYDSGSNALTVLSVRFALMAAISYAWCRMRHRALRIDRRLVASCYLMGVLYFVGIGSYLTAVAYIPVSLAVLLFYTFPILTVLLAFAVNGRRPRFGEIVTLLLAFAGIFLALDVNAVEVRALGVCLGLLAALAISMNLLLSERILAQISLPVFTFHLSLSAFGLAALAAWTTSSFALPHGGEGGRLAFAVMLVAFIVAFLSNYTGVRLIGSVPLSMILNLEPVATILLALLVLGETMSMRQALGAGFVVTAVVAAQLIRMRHNSRQRERAEAR